MVPPSLVVDVSPEWPGESPTARVKSGPSDSLYLSLGEWPRLPFTARIERAHSYRARSASKKGTWLLPARLRVIFSILLPPSQSPHSLPCTSAHISCTMR